MLAFLSSKQIAVILFITCFFLCGLQHGLSQNVQWAKQFSGNGIDVGAGVTTDATGNIYNIGHFADTVAFGTTTLISAGSTDIFVSKINPANGAVVWARSYGGTIEELASGISSDDQGNVYITGSFASTPCTFGNFTITPTSPAPNLEIFVAKLDASTGNVLWVKSLGGSDYDHGGQIISDKANGVYISGVYSSVAAFGTFTSTSLGNWDLFVAKMDAATGNVAWVLPFGTADYDLSTGIALDPSGDVYATGTFTGSMSLGNSAVTTNTTPNSFIAKINKSNGSVNWAKSFGAFNPAQGFYLATDAAGNLYADGKFSGTVQFDSFGLTTGAFDNNYMLKLNPANGGVLWAALCGFAGPLSVYNNSVIITGSFYNTISIGTTTFTAINGSADDIAVISMNSANGTINQAVQIGGAGSELNIGHAMDNSGNLYMTGAFNGAAAFNTFSFTAANQSFSSTPYDAYLFKIAPQELNTGLPVLSSSANLFSLRPNPFNETLNISLNDNSGIRSYALVITDVLGKTVFEINDSQSTTTLNLQALKPGIYLVSLTGDNGGRWVKKIVKE